jgi:hypothetical protein
MLAAAPQRIDPRRSAPSDPAARFDWQKTYTILFDGTERCPLRRQLFADDSPPPRPAVLQRFVDVPAPKERLRGGNRSIEARSLMILARGDKTARELTAALKAHQDSVRASLRRLMMSGQVRVVGHVANPETGHGQRERLVVYGVREA